MFIANIQGRIFLYAMMVVSLSFIFLDQQRIFFGLILLVLVSLRIVLARNKPLLMLFLVLLILFIPRFLCAHQHLNEPYKEKMFTNAEIIVNWATLKKTERGYQVDGKLNQQKLKLYVKGEVPKQKENLKGELLWNNGDRKRFSYGYHDRAYLLAKGYSGRGKLKQATVTKRGKTPFLFLMQEFIMDKVSRLPYWCARYMKTLVFGFSDVNDHTNELYASLGISHLFSLSGLNVSLFLFLFRYPLWRLKVTKEHTLYFEGGYLLLIYFLCYESVGFLRSSLMHELYQWQKKYQCSFTMIDIWSLSLLLHLLFNPWLLLTAGGGLSYSLSFFVMVLFQNQKSRLKPMILFFIFSLPILSRYFFQVAPLSLIMNLICVPLFTFVLLPLFLFVLVTLFLVPLPSFYLLIEQGLILFQKGLLLFEPIKPITMPPLSNLLLLFYLFIVILFLTKKKNAKQCLILLLLLYSLSYYPLHGEITMIDVGQGDSLFIRAPLTKEATLIDCGGNVYPTQKKNATYTVIPFLKSKGVSTLRSLYITHADKDHCGDILELTKHFSIRRVYYSAGCEQTPFFKTVLLQLKKMQIKAIPLQGERRWQEQGMDWHLLSPKTKGEGKNNDSLVMRLTTRNRSFLMTGDLEKEGEALLLNELKQTDILKVGHHGSRTATSVAFLNKINPKLAWISCGKNNRFSHPHHEVMMRLKNKQVNVYRTDQQGSISYYFDWWQEKLVTAK